MYRVCIGARDGDARSLASPNHHGVLRHLLTTEPVLATVVTGWKHAL